MAGVKNAGKGLEDNTAEWTEDGDKVTETVLCPEANGKCSEF